MTTVHVGVSSFTTAGGGLFVSTVSQVSFTAEDPSPGSGVARIEAGVDGAVLTTIVGPLSFSDGPHVTQYRSVDNAGNVETTRSLSLFSDGSPPQTTLLVNGSPAPGGQLFLAATDQLALSSTDTASGVAAIRFSQDGSPFQDFTSTVTLSTGSSVLFFFGIDHVANLELVRTVNITVPGGSPEPPPPPGPPGFDPAPFLARVVGACGEVEVKGGARLEGNVAANGLVFLNGQATISGNILSGALRRVGQTNVSGGVGISSHAVVCEPINLAALLTAIGGTAKPIPAEFLRDGQIVVTGKKTLLLPAGTYVAAGLSVTGGGTIETSGRVNLFVRGPIRVEGRSLVNQSETTDLVVFSDSVEPAVIGGGAEWRGILYAPRAELSIAGNSDVRGHFHVRGVRAVGSSVSVANPHLIPAKDLRVSTRSGTSLGLKWDRNGNTDPNARYEVIWGTGPNTCETLFSGLFTGFSQVVVGSTLTTLTGLKPKTVHTLAVHITTPGGSTGNTSNFVIVNTLAAGELEQPVNVGDPGYFICGGQKPALHDTTPPVTELRFIGPTGMSTSGVFQIGPSTQSFFEVLDPNITDAITSGATNTYYIIDPGPVPITTALAQKFIAPFTFSLGEHTVAYFSVDNAGNVEATKVSSVSVSATPHPPPPPVQLGDGLALGADPLGNIWEVFSVQDGAGISKFKPDGTFISSMTLPGAVEAGRFTIAFTPSGEPVVVGNTSGIDGDPVDLAVYRVSQNVTLISSATFDSGLGAVDIALDSSGDVWITGAIATGGSPEGGDLQARLALWRYDTTSGLLSLASTYSGPGGLDAGFGIALEPPPSGNIWVAGFTQNPASTVPEKLDLALWKFSPDGTTLVAGPFIRPGFLRSIEDEPQARIVYADNALFIASHKFNNPGDTDLHLVRFALDGNLQFEKRWSGTANLDEEAGDIAADDAGVAVTGNADSGARIGVWRYGFQGVLQSAGSDPGVFSSQELLLRPGRTWLAVGQSSVPYLFQGLAENELSGQDIPVVFDVTAPGLSMEPPDASTVTTARPLIAGVYSDLDSGIDIASVRLFLDGTQITAQAVVTASSISFRPASDLAQGVRVASASAADRAGNVSSATATFLIDSIAPTTLLVIGTPKFGAEPVKITTGTPLGFALSEPGRTLFAVNGGALTQFSGAITLSTAGVRTLRFFSEDLAGNRESEKSVALGVDASAPVTQLTLVGPTFSNSRLFVASHTGVGFLAFDPVVDGIAAGVARTEYRLDAAPFFTTFASTFALAEGEHQLAFRSGDNLGQFEADRSTSIFSDATPPVTTLLVNGAAAIGDSLVAKSTDAFTFESADTASGLFAVRFAIDGGVEQTFSAAFSLEPGAHTISYFARDNVANVEQKRTLAIGVSAPDTEAPSLTLSPVRGSTVTTARPLIVATYADPSGLDLGSFRLVLDGIDVTAQTAVSVSSAAFRPSADLTQGFHVAFARVADPAGHMAESTSTFFIDSSAPTTALVVGTPKFGADPVFVSSRTLLGFTASEPGQTFFAVDSMSFGLFTSAFTIAAEGLRTINFFSQDALGNQEQVKSTQVFVDRTAPVTTLLVNNVPAVGSLLTAASTDFFSLESTDTASGVGRILSAIDGGGEQVFSSPFSLSPGTHTVSFRAEDNVQNMESLRTIAVAAVGPDTQAPSLALAPIHASTVTTPTPAIVASYSDAGSGIAAATVKLILNGTDVTAQAAITSSSAAFIPSFSLAQGTHVVAAQVSDRAGNLAQAQATWLLDSLAPVTTLLVNGIPAAGATLTASTTDVFSFSAVDAGTLVQQTLFSLDGGAEQIFAVPFSLAAGGHTLSFRSRDRAGNLEAAKSVLITITQPTGFIVSLDLKPETLNLRSQGEFVSAHIEIAGAESAAHIVTGTVRVSQVDGRTISPPIFIDPRGPVTLEDADFDGISELKVKFPREQLNAVLPGDREVKVTVAGAFRSGATFEGTDTIRTLGKGLTVSIGDDDQGFGLIAAYAFPNPAKGSNPTIRLQTRGTADFVQITIYNVFKEVIHTASPGAPQRIDGKWTYDYTWSVSGARTGVYIYRIQARKAGFPEINAVGRVAVIR